MIGLLEEKALLWGEVVKGYLLAVGVGLLRVTEEGVDAVEVDEIVVSLDAGVEACSLYGVEIGLQLADCLLWEECSGDITVEGVVDNGTDALHEVMEMIVIGVADDLYIGFIDFYADGEGGLLTVEASFVTVTEMNDELENFRAWCCLEMAYCSCHLAISDADEVVFLQVNITDVNEGESFLLALHSADEVLHLLFWNGDGDVVLSPGEE